MGLRNSWWRILTENWIQITNQGYYLWSNVINKRDKKVPRLNMQILLTQYFGKIAYFEKKIILGSERLDSLCHKKGMYILPS